MYETSKNEPVIYVFGGWDDQGKPLEETEVYSIKYKAWAAGPKLKKPVLKPMAAWVGDDVFILGGGARGANGKSIEGGMEGKTISAIIDNKVEPIKLKLGTSRAAGLVVPLDKTMVDVNRLCSLETVNDKGVASAWKSLIQVRSGKAKKTS